MKKMDFDKYQLERNKTKSDGKRFGFLNAIGAEFDRMLQKVNAILHMVDESKPYKIDYKDVVEQYHELGVGDIDEFSSNYTFTYAISNGLLSDKVVKHAIYEDVRDYLWEKKRLGEIK